MPDKSGTRADKIRALLEDLFTQGISDERILRAIAMVPRERFVPESLLQDAWSNVALPIGAGQTISQPYIVALMTQALALSGNERVLEVGTGSGYQAAVLAELAAKVISIERQPILAANAEKLLRDLEYNNIEIHIADGSAGWPAAAPYDRIIVTAAAPRLPLALRDQLSPESGRLVVPVGSASEQALVAIERNDDRFTPTQLGPVRFVPLIGRAGFAPKGSENGFHYE
ncbi:MAG: protein-L-isoaspartate(D-aspartate) O-methyltransferase [Thermomicrobiales bacterium]|jgi:protein-L-isoaspartate(D-aspartate) O-methyltransferase